MSLSRIGQGLVQHGHAVHLLAGDAPIVESFIELGLPATRVPTGDTGLVEARALSRILSHIGAHILLVDRPRDLRLGALASLGHPIALVNRYNLSRARPPNDLLSRLAYRRVRLTIFVSDSSASGALRLAPYLRRRPYRVIHEGVDPERFRPDPVGAHAFRQDYGLGDTQFVLAVGSLTLDKRYDFLLDVWSRLGMGAPTLVVCGEGQHGERLRASAEQLGLNTRFLGYVQPEALRGAYSAAICLVHAGAVETFGLSVLEGMACGSAVLGVEGGAVPEVIGDAGVTVPVDDPAAFCVALRALLADPARRAELGQAARRRCLDHFSLARMRESYVEAFESVVFSSNGNQ